MCSGAILLYGIPRVVIGENTNFMGEEDLLRSRGVDVIVLNDVRCTDLMRRFIEEHPEVSFLLFDIARWFLRWDWPVPYGRNGMKI